MGVAPCNRGNGDINTPIMAGLKWQMPGWRIEQKYSNGVLIGNWSEDRLGKVRVPGMKLYNISCNGQPTEPENKCC